MDTCPRIGSRPKRKATPFAGGIGVAIWLNTINGAITNSWRRAWRTKVDGSLGRSYCGGLGIGLALAKNLVEMHEGRLKAFSAGMGEGCVFTVKLPVLLEASLHTPRTVLEPGERRGRSLRVLVVEDNVAAADSLSMLLRLYGHDVQLARTGTTALEMAAASCPDVVLLDRLAGHGRLSGGKTIARSADSLLACEVPRWHPPAPQKGLQTSNTVHTR